MTYSQRDPQWANETLGTGPGSIGGWGCYLTSYAEVLTSCGHVVNPSELNRMVSYVDGNMLTDSETNNLFGGDVVTYQVWDFRNQPANLDMINDGDPSTRFIIEVDFDHDLSDGIQTHFVTESSWNGTTLMINDPWYGETDNFATHYGDNLAETIIKVVGLRWNSAVIPTAQATPAPVVETPVIETPVEVPAVEVPTVETPTSILPSTIGVQVAPPLVQTLNMDNLTPGTSKVTIPVSKQVGNMDKLKSRKFWVTVGTVASALIAGAVGYLNSGQAFSIVGLMSALYVVVQGLIDHKNAGI